MTRFDKPLPPEPLEPGQRVDFFLSHKSDCKPIVREVATAIKTAGMTYWLDEQHALPQKDGMSNVDQGLKQSDYLIFFVTRDVLKSGWAMAEIGSRMNTPDSYLLLLVDLTFEEWQEIRPEVLAKHPANLADGLERFIQQLRIVTKQLHPPAPDKSEVLSILRDFEKWSSYGQSLEISIQGRYVELPVVEEILGSLPTGVSVLKGGPGSGKTGALRQLFKRSTCKAKLFLKMDLILDEVGLKVLNKLADQCARVARVQPVAVYLDSLDVLSVHRQTECFRNTLKFLDRFASIPEVSVLVACRNFDLRFDPYLRSRKWAGKFEVKPLDFKVHVAPLLVAIGESVPQDPELQALLCVPQYLGLYADLRHRAPDCKVSSIYELYGAYLEQLVEQDGKLGAPALSSLEAMASKLWSARVQSLPRCQFQGSASVQKLASLQILDASNPSNLRFFHQTWLEYLVVRGQLANGKSLLEFILGQDQLPFCRPYVRAYFFYLYDSGQNIAQELRAAIQSSAVTWHVKRLLVGSMAEREAPAAAASLVNFLRSSHPDLLQVLLRGFRTVSWLDCLVEHWLPTAWNVPTQETNLPWFLAGLRRFCDTRSAQCLGIFLQALQTQLLWGFDSVIENESIARLPDSRRIVEALLERGRGLFGPELARWLEFRGEQDDDLLWIFLVREIKCEGSHIQLGSGTTLLPDDFLATRFCKSDLLKTRMLEWLLELEAQAASSQRSSSLTILNLDLREHSSWAPIRHKGMRPHDGLHELMNAFEQAVESAALLDLPWWRTRHGDLRDSKLSVLRYLHVKALRSAVAVQLQASIEVLNELSHLASGYSYEWTQLVRAAFPLLDEEQRVDFLERLLADSLAQEKDFAVACCILAIPCCYRSPEAQEILDKVMRRAPDLDCSPPIVSHSGYIRSAVSAEQVLQLSGKGVLDLVAYYREKGFEPSGWESSAFIGGEQEMLATLTTATSLHPAKFFELLPALEEDDALFWSVLQGLARGLRCSSGDLKSDYGEPHSSIPSQGLARYALSLSESRKTDVRFLDILRGCVCDIGGGELLPGLVEELISFKGAAPPSNELVRVNGPLSAGLNCEQGTICEALLVLLGWQVEHDKEPGDRLVERLLSICRNDNGPLRALVLRRLPAIIWYAPEVGWPLFELCLPSAPQGLWDDVERCLYVNYSRHPEKVEEILTNLLAASSDQCGELWGRLTALMTIAGTASINPLLDAARSHPSVWNGAMNVFATNLSHGKSQVLTLLDCCPHGSVKIDLLSRSLFQEANFPHIEPVLVEQVLDLLAGASTYELVFLDRWLQWLANVDVEFALDVLEGLDKRNMLEKPRYRELAPILVALLREVDFRNEPGFTSRVIAIHDRFAKIEPGVLDLIYEGVL